MLSDALRGDSTLFARQDYVEEAWRIVDPVLRARTPVHEYVQGTWGPADAQKNLSPEGGWHDPVVDMDRRGTLPAAWPNATPA